MQCQPYVQVEAATQEYRSSDIICLGLRSIITQLEQQLKDSRDVGAKQVKLNTRLVAPTSDEGLVAC